MPGGCGKAAETLSNTHTHAHTHMHTYTHTHTHTDDASWLVAYLILATSARFSRCSTWSGERFATRVPLTATISSRSASPGHARPFLPVTVPRVMAACQMGVQPLVSGGHAGVVCRAARTGGPHAVTWGGAYVLQRYRNQKEIFGVHNFIIVATLGVDFILEFR